MRAQAQSVSGSSSASCWAALSPLPQELKHGVGALHGGSFYFGLGSAGSAWWRAGAESGRAGAQRLADFPGPPREQAIAAAIGAHVYVFGGAGAASPGAAPSALTDVHRYDTRNDTWSRLPADCPQALLGAAAWAGDDRALFVGGVSKAVFDGFLAGQAAAPDETQRQRLARAYLSAATDAYGFNPGVCAFSPQDNAWQDLGRVPGAPVVGAALASNGNGFALLGGELKPGLRSRANWLVQVGDHGLDWAALPDLPAAPGEATQEGLAGTFAGHSHDVLLLAGGTNFPGAQARFAAGQGYAHEGLSKTWRDDIWALVGGRWQWAGRLPQGRAHGLALQSGEQLLLLGGETAGGAALASSLALEWDGTAVRVGHG